jgi:tetratricopeptide (TPR) repeat protein
VGYDFLVRRILGICLLAGGVAAALYGLVMTRQEARYLELIEQGDAALAREDIGAAIEVFTIAIEMKRESMAGHLKRGEAYRRRRDFESALRDLRQAAELDPLAPHPRELLGDVDAAIGQHSQAAERYREYLKLDERAPRVLYKLGLALYETRQIPAAEEALRQAIALDGRLAEAHYLLGVCLGELNRPAQAITSLERALELNPLMLHAREELAAVNGRLSRQDQQKRHLAALSDLDQRSSREVTLALVYAREGHTDRAMARLRNAAQEFPDDPYVHAALGRLWLDRLENGGSTDLKEALEVLEVAVSGDPTSDALTLYGRALAATGQLMKAQTVLTRATQRFPVDPLAFYYLADVADQRGKPRIADRAMLDYAALEGLTSPRLNAEVLARIAEAHFRAGNLAAARNAVDRALKKEPATTSALALKERLK